MGHVVLKSMSGRDRILLPVLVRITPMHYLGTMIQRGTQISNIVRVIEALGEEHRSIERFLSVCCDHLSAQEVERFQVLHDELVSSKLMLIARFEESARPVLRVVGR
jgi:hypothetical protein